jgi:hypothetical protein
LIFNRNNIYINKQYHDPAHINYNLYEKEEWMPYITLKDDQIWRGKFEPFYSPTSFGPVLSPNLINKMTESLIKEVRVGITAARSGMNLQTKFKKKNEAINGILKLYCNYTEDRALNRISEIQFQEKIKDWNDMIRSKLPKFYRMESKCIFFNFYELEIIRREINEDLEQFFKTKIKNLMFATSAKVYSYMNQIVSVRIILAKFYKIPLEDIEDPEEFEEYKQEMKMNPENFVEEEEDTDDEKENASMVVKTGDHVTNNNKEVKSIKIENRIK